MQRGATEGYEAVEHHNPSTVNTRNHKADLYFQEITLAVGEE